MLSSQLLCFDTDKGSKQVVNNGDFSDQVFVSAGGLGEGGEAKTGGDGGKG